MTVYVKEGVGVCLLERVGEFWALWSLGAETLFIIDKAGLEQFRGQREKEEVLSFFPGS